MDGSEQPQPKGFEAGGPVFLTSAAALVGSGEEHRVSSELVTGDGREHDLVLMVFEHSPDLDPVFDR